ncbi:putative DNA binding domain-containing protein [Corynebacterium lizhenjunii]|uniref:Putative DNA binding domain-containing protein n=1 Tax=Corynebacterium lizhenjunii TaxID=2709394 RepID=A0A7T0KF53_9CORY|nr:RNA-binding domain-containing protein [Corynebacterium lizhenjunii]QPK79394.1 putative DNA binding domain-containing protein [Corynebacterium lizhenjunii]
MSSSRRQRAELESRVRRLINVGREQPWLEFKEDGLREGARIAEYVSALGNSACLSGEPAGYLLWGISDSGEIVGTTFDWEAAKGKGNADLKPWLTEKISPKIDLTFDSLEIDGKRVVILRVPAAREAPLTFEDKRYIRIDSYNKNLIKNPQAERQLWLKLQQFSRESELVASNLESSDILELLSREAFVMNRKELLHLEGEALVETMRRDGAVTYTHEDGWGIPLWSALMYAQHLSSFDGLNSYQPRIFLYSGESTDTFKREKRFDQGYALSFGRVIELVSATAPGGEGYDSRSGRRIDVPTLPTIAFREVYANALLHQDLNDTGKFVTISVFADRIEVANPGTPLVDPDRFIDAVSDSRNQRLGEALRRAYFVEQRGSGWDKIVQSLEEEHFPPALVRVNGSTVVSLSAYRPYSMMSMRERMQAVYQHTCLSLLRAQPVNNASVRARFGLDSSHAAQVSRLLSATVDENLIRLYDPEAGPRSRRYVPNWAA